MEKWPERAKRLGLCRHEAQSRWRLAMEVESDAVRTMLHRSLESGP